MAPTYGSLDLQSVQKALTARSLLQLYRKSFFARAAVTEFDDERSFELGEAVSIRRPKDYGEAEDINPRSGGLTLSEAGHVIVNLTLEHLYGRGFPVYSHDARINASRYIADYSQSAGGAIRKSFDNYLYDTGFRDYSRIPSTGTVSFAAQPPIAIVAATSGVSLAPFNADTLIAARVLLEQTEAFADGECYAALSPAAKGAFLGDATLVEGEAAASIDGGQLLRSGISQYAERYGFMCGGSNAVRSQSAGTEIIEGSGSNSGVISAAAADTTVFFEGDLATQTPLGAVRLTIGSTGALDAQGTVAVGRIVQINNNAGTAIKAYGVVLRVDLANRHVWIVPYSPAGAKLPASAITTTASSEDRLSVPLIPSINAAYHREHLVFATRRLREPSAGSGAIAQTAAEPESGVIMQMFSGSYSVKNFSEECAMAMLCGAVATDARKAVLVLSQ